MKPMLKAPGSGRLKLKCDEPLSNFAFKFNLRRYSMGAIQQVVQRACDTGTAEHGRAMQADPIKSTLKAPGPRRLKL
jgi:hypothetical protein